MPVDPDNESRPESPRGVGRSVSSSALPTLAIVTPSLNQARYLEQTMTSVLDQGYDQLEYVVVDGGSTDGSAEIIERYSDRLAAHWSSPDKGHADALNRGFARTSAEIMGWLNSDDLLLPGALTVVGQVFSLFPHVQWITSSYQACVDDEGVPVTMHSNRGFSGEAFRMGMHGGLYARYRLSFVQQESTFWRRELWERAGGFVSVEDEPASDFELWARFFDHAELYAVDTALGMFRYHPAQRTADDFERYLQAARNALARHGVVRPERRTLMAARARGFLGPEVLERLRIGWEVPYLQWSRKDYSWHEGRRRIA
jgi:glycosyltransferase involved in cell wall biosynthesis